MAKVTVKMPDDFLKKLSKLGNKTDEITAKCLEAGADVVLDKVKNNLHASLSGNSTGELEHSLGISSVRQDKSGNSNIKIGFTENRSDGKSNAMLANVLEYGKSNQIPRPFLEPARKQSRKDCQNKMIKVLEREIDKL